jgi:hypothetical protein
MFFSRLYMKHKCFYDVEEEEEDTQCNAFVTQLIEQGDFH